MRAAEARHCPRACLLRCLLFQCRLTSGRRFQKAKTHLQQVFLYINDTWWWPYEVGYERTRRQIVSSTQERQSADRPSFDAFTRSTTTTEPCKHAITHRESSTSARGRKEHQCSNWNLRAENVMVLGRGGFCRGGAHLCRAVRCAALLSDDQWNLDRKCRKRWHRGIERRGVRYAECALRRSGMWQSLTLKPVVI